MRLGVKFKGKELMQIRTGNEGECLSPHRVPFHRPDMIYRGEIKDYGNKGKWWLRIGIPDSTEQFYQQNKILEALV